MLSHTHTHTHTHTHPHTLTFFTSLKWLSSMSCMFRGAIKLSLNFMLLDSCTKRDKTSCCTCYNETRAVAVFTGVHTHALIFPPHSSLIPRLSLLFHTAWNMEQCVEHDSTYSQGVVHWMHTVHVRIMQTTDITFSPIPMFPRF